MWLTHLLLLLLLLLLAVWELITSQRVFEEGLSIGQIFYMSEWTAVERVLAAAKCCTVTVARHTALR